MPVVWSRVQDLLDQILNSMCSWLHLLELRWSETARSATPGISVYKIHSCYPWICAAGLPSLPPPTGHGGEEKRKDGASTCASGGRQGSPPSLARRRRVRPAPLAGSAVLPWWKTGRSASPTRPYFNKCPRHLCLGGLVRLHLLLAGLGGEGEEKMRVAATTLQRRRSRCLERATSVAASKRRLAPAVAIFGHRVGPAALGLDSSFLLHRSSLEDLLRLRRGDERCSVLKLFRPRGWKRRLRRKVSNCRQWTRSRFYASL
jgi:hypothetical protein